MDFFSLLFHIYTLGAWIFDLFKGVFTGMVLIAGDSSIEDETRLPNTITLNTTAFIPWAITGYFLCTVSSSDEMHQMNNRRQPKLSSSSHYHTFLGIRIMYKIEKVSLYFHHFPSFLNSIDLSQEILYYWLFMGNNLFCPHRSQGASWLLLCHIQKQSDYNAPQGATFR